METSSAQSLYRPGEAANPEFQKTRWSLVLKACSGSGQALEDLARIYWPAVYAFLRREGFSPEDAEDRTQDTFARVLQGGRLAAVDPTKGRFRTFLCACAAHEASHFRERDETEKRGRNRTFSIDTVDTERQLASLPSTDAPAEQVFDRAWSKVLVVRGLKNLQSEYQRVGKGEVCAMLMPFLNSGIQRGDHSILAAKLGLTEGHVRVAWGRFKLSFIEHLRREVAETVPDTSEVDAELIHLMRAWLAETS